MSLDEILAWWMDNLSQDEQDALTQNYPEAQFEAEIDAVLREVYSKWKASHQTHQKPVKCPSCSAPLLLPELDEAARMTSTPPNPPQHSFRYALGRRSHAVKEVVDHLITTWSTLPENYHTMIAEEIDEAIKSNHTRASIDIREWKRILNLRAAKIEEKEFNSDKNGSFWQTAPSRRGHRRTRAASARRVFHVIHAPVHNSLLSIGK